MTATAAPMLVRRVLRSSAITLLGSVAAQALRLGSNLILTRLLYPEAFGLMALVTTFLIALAMLSDVGLGPAIMQSRRGDDPTFLDTAWTIQIVRGFVLWIAALAVAPLAAWFYGQPELLTFLPVASLGLVIAAFRPMRLETANRHLRAGLVTILELAAQLAGLAVGILLAWLYESVWALVALALVTQVVHVALLHRLMPGHLDRLGWDRTAAAELVHFGKYIFVATLLGFVSEQADKFILGRYLDLREFGIYNMALALGSVPLMLCGMIRGRVLIPVYRESPPAACALNAARIRKLRAGALAGLLVLCAVLGLGGAGLVRFLYDPRYHEAAGIVALVAVSQAPALLILSCDMAALAMGDSRRFVWLTVARAALVSGGLLLGFEAGGLAGAIVGQGLGNLAAYPVLAWLLRPHGAWDPALDAQFLAAAAALAAATVWLNQSALAAMP